MATAQWRPLIQSGLLLPLSLARRSLRIITRARNTQSVRLSLDFAQSLSYIITRVWWHPTLSTVMSQRLSSLSRSQSLNHTHKRHTLAIKTRDQYKKTPFFFSAVFRCYTFLEIRERLG